MPLSRKKRYSASVIALLSLVFLGIGAVIGMLGQTTFHPLPFARPESLVQLTAGLNLWQADTLAATLRLAPEVASFATFASSNGLDVTHDGVTRNASVVQTSPNFFDLLELPLVRANLGAYRGERGTAVLSTALARQLNINAGAALGSSVQVGGRGYTVVGLVDPINAYPVGTDLWFAESSPGPIWFGLLRTRSSADVDALTLRLNVAARTVTGDKQLMVSAHPLSDAARPSLSSEQRGVSAGIVLFAVIAVLNFGLLGVGEARRREQEFAIRVALGAGRSQVAREFVVSQLGLIGTALIFAAVFLEGARVVLPGDLSLNLSGLPGIVWALLGIFALVLLLVAIIPRRIASGAGEMEVLRRVSSRGSRFEQAWNRGFIGMQFAVTAFLLVAGGMAVLTLRDLHRTAYGFEVEGRVIGTVSLGKVAGLESDGATQRAALDLEAAARSAFAGRVAVFRVANRSMEGGQYKFATDPPTTGPTNAASIAAIVAPMGVPWQAEDVTPEFFDLTGIRIVAGRGFRASDDVTSEPVVILSETAAKRFGGPQEALGKRLRFGEDDGEWRTIVGVASDAYSIDRIGFGAQLLGRRQGSGWRRSFVYRSFSQVVARAQKSRYKDGRTTGTLGGVSILVKNPPPDVAVRLIAAVSRALSGAKVDVRPLSAYLDWSGQVDRAGFTIRLLGEFAIAGFLLALLGTVVLIDEVVRSRTSEIGIRRALGAQSPNLVALASRETFIAGTIGVLFGTIVGARFGPVAASWIRTSGAYEKVLAPIGFNVPLMIGVPSLLLLLIATGTALRALRAARLDPMEALRAN